MLSLWRVLNKSDNDPSYIFKDDSYEYVENGLRRRGRAEVETPLGSL